MKKKENNTIIKVRLILGVCIILLVIIDGSMWFAYQKPQTVWQDMSSRIGYGKPSVDTASKIVFLGDSITYLEDWNVLFNTSDIANAGISGNTTEDILKRLDGVLETKPQKLFVMIGINDLLRGKDVSAVLANYEAIVREIHSQSPRTIVYIQSVLPINNDILKSQSVDSQKIIDLNSSLKVLADKDSMVFVDLYPYFCGPDNKLYARYAKDGLHPNSYGYAIWKKVIAAYID